MLSSHSNRTEAESDFSTSNGYNRVSSETSVSNDNLDSILSSCKTDQCQMQSNINTKKKKSVLLNLKSGRINSVALPEEFVELSRRFSNSAVSARKKWLVTLAIGALAFFLLGFLFAKSMFEQEECVRKYRHFFFVYTIVRRHAHTHTHKYTVWVFTNFTFGTIIMLAIRRALDKKEEG